MSAELRRLRHELAGALRLADRFGFSEGICNHFSAVAPLDDDLILINPLGLHWSEIGPDELLLIDGDGNVKEGDGEVEATALHIHVAGHRANRRHRAILHVHMSHLTSKVRRIQLLTARRGPAQTDRNSRKATCEPSRQPQQNTKPN